MSKPNIDDQEQFLHGMIYSIGGRFYEGSVAWLSFMSGTTPQRVTTKVDSDNRFKFKIPTATNLTKAVVGVDVEGIQPVDLEINAGRLDPGDIVLSADDAVPSHLRYGL